MGNIIALLGDGHAEAQSLLPWYVSGRIDGADRSCVEAHLAECPECRADLAAERRLAAEWAAMPLETEASWMRLRERVIREKAVGSKAAALSRLAAVARAVMAWRPSLAGAGWALAAAQGLALAAIGLSFRPATPEGAYHTLGAAPASAAGNMLVMFDPDTSEGRFRDVLEANHARLVDGPTQSGAYVLHVPVEERAAVLVRMRARPDVELAQPIDPGVTR